MKPAIILIFLIPLVSAMYAGSSYEVYHFDQCDSLTVNVTADLPIDKGEYWFIGCEETEDNLWSCDCTDDYHLTINTKPSTLNTYHVLMEYTTQKKVQRARVAARRGDYVCEIDCNDWGPCIGGTQYRSCSDDCPSSLAPAESRPCRTNQTDQQNQSDQPDESGQSGGPENAPQKDPNEKGRDGNNAVSNSDSEDDPPGITAAAVGPYEGVSLGWKIAGLSLIMLLALFFYIRKR